MRKSGYSIGISLLDCSHLTHIHTYRERERERERERDYERVCIHVYTHTYICIYIYNEKKWLYSRNITFRLFSSHILTEREREREREERERWCIHVYTHTHMYIYIYNEKKGLYSRNTTFRLFSPRTHTERERGGGESVCMCLCMCIHVYMNKHLVPLNYIINLINEIILLDHLKR